MSTVAAILTRLAEGSASKRLLMSEESVHGPEVTMPGAASRNVVKSWSVGVNALDANGREDGCLGEWRIEWYQFRDYRRLSMEISVFADGMAAFVATGLADALVPLGETPEPAQVLNLLLDLGFADVTPRATVTA